MLITLLYCLISTFVALLNMWIVRQLTHKILSPHASPHIAEYFYKYPSIFYIIDIILWIALIILGISLKTIWWIILPLLFYFSYREGFKSALRTEYEYLEFMESQGRLKKIDGTPITAKEEMNFLIQFAKNRFSGKYKDFFHN